jgi:outer membrane protein assembly factor BamD (BamD/ComL family)
MMRSRLRTGATRRLLLLGVCTAAVCGCQGFGEGKDVVFAQSPPPANATATAPPANATPTPPPGNAPAIAPASATTAAPATADPGTPRGSIVKASFWDDPFERTGIVTPPPADVFLMSPDGLVGEPQPKPDSPEAKLAGAHELFRRNELDVAETIYHRLSENTHNPAKVAEEARYYEAESLRLQGRYPKAADTFVDLLNKFPQTPYRDAALQHMFDIANYWLEDTREAMKQDREVAQGKRSVAWPHFFHFEPSKPILGEEDRALDLLNQVHLHDMNGPLADKAMFLCGGVSMFIGDYRGAVTYFKAITDHHPNSIYAPQAVELGITALHLSTGGPDYDGKNSAEARRLIHVAFDNYPELAANKEKREFLQSQLSNITYQQAEKDYRQADFYRRTGHPGAAYFYYGLVARTYRDTPYAKRALEQMQELRAQAEKDGTGPLPAPPTNTPPPPPPTTQVPTRPTNPEPAPGPRPLVPTPAPG